MPRQRSPDSIKAEKMYKDGTSLVDIGKALGVPAGTVRRWKSTQNWEGKKQEKKGERSEKKKPKPKAKKKASVRKRKKGAQPGNTNGTGAPTGNKRAEKHGAYSAVYWDTLDQDEMQILDNMTSDEEELLMQQITLYTIRERRIMKAISKYRSPDEHGRDQVLYIASVSTQENIRKWSRDPVKAEEERLLYEERVREKVEARERLPGEAQQKVTQTSATIDLLARLERELTSVQSQKTKAITALAQLRLDKQKLNGENQGNDVVRAWADAVLNARRES